MATTQSVASQSIIFVAIYLVLPKGPSCACVSEVLTTLMFPALFNALLASLNLRQLINAGPAFALIPQEPP
jgi:hypothetical protein